MAPFRVAPTGGTQIGENGIEQERAEPGRSDESGEGAESAVARSGGVVGGELSAEQTDLGAVSGWRSRAAVLERVRVR